MIIPVVDLRGEFFDVRQQGSRQSCLPFSTTAAHEHKRSPAGYLSVEYLFYHSVQATSHKDPDKGLSFLAVKTALSADGQPPELEWPYLPAQPPTGSWNPPSAVNDIKFGALHHVSNNYADVCAVLDAGDPVIAGFIITDAFYRPDRDGIIETKANDPQRAGHAVLIVGHGASVDGTAYILIRNSWGQAWGVNGYAWLSEKYTNSHLKGAARLS